MKFFVTCAKGTEGALRRELADLRIRAPKGERGGVSFEGQLADGVKACLWSRVGMRVLLELDAFRAPDAHALYDGVRGIDWRAHASATSTIAVNAHVSDSPTLRHSGFAALKVKDAVVDALRDRLGARPNVDTKSPDVAIVLHVEGDDARVYLDLAGEPLHRRGYRVAMTDAPLKESLAAAVLALGGVDVTQPVVDPMTGSGTFAIEHALRARHLPPGASRGFAFERWPSHDARHALAKLKDEARAVALPHAPAAITASDLAPQAVEAARRNAKAAGVDEDVTFAVADARRLQRPAGDAGSVILNPPYGERLGATPPAARPRREEPKHAAHARVPTRRPVQDDRRDDVDLDALSRLYHDVARALLPLTGWQIVVLTASPLFLDAMLRNPEVSHRLWNGPLEARLLRYRL